MTRVAVVVFEGCDLVDVVGPYEVLLTANRLAARAGGEAPFTLLTCSVDGGPVTGYGGLGVVPADGALATAGPLDVLLVPGMVDLATAGDAALVGAVRAAGESAAVVASVCTGAFVLQAAGLLGDATVTTHWEDVPALAALRPGGRVTADVRWVDAGRVVTGGAMLDGVDMALHLVARLAGRELALATAVQMDHVWQEARPHDGPGVGTTGP